MTPIVAVVVKPDARVPVDIKELDGEDLVQILKTLDCDTLAQLTVPEVGATVLTDRDGISKNLPVNVRATAYIKAKYGMPSKPVRGTAVFVAPGTKSAWGSCPTMVMNDLLEFTQL